MLISRNWLQSYFTKELPDGKALAEVLMLHAFEVEDVYQKDQDWILDVDVLPNRAHDCLCHLGFVHELATLLNYDISPEPVVEMEADNTFDLVIENKEACRRYIAAQVSGVSLDESPSWIQEKLAAMGQRSINTLVDLSNIVMFDVGQPLHVFDAAKIEGPIIVRYATAGEVMTSLSGEEIVLEHTDLVIADEKGILALAGVKGGVKAEVDAHTTDIVIESANFDPLHVRKTARRVKILTDASKRYENELSSEKALLGIERMLMLLKSIYKEAALVSYTDSYQQKEKEHTITLSLASVKNLLGLEIGEAEVHTIFDRLSFPYEYHDGVYTVSIPCERLDLRIAEDLIEEIGRVYGYHNIPVQSLDAYVFSPKLNPLHYVSHCLRNLLVAEGYTELMTYSFVPHAKLEVYNPVASDKKALREDLHTLFTPAFERNIRSSDFLGTDCIRAFEIGRVYQEDGEQNLCHIAIHPLTKAARKKYGSEEEQRKELMIKINSLFDLELPLDTSCIHLDELVDTVKLPSGYDDLFDLRSYTHDDRFHTISAYPYVSRDISLWIPPSCDAQEIAEAIKACETRYLQKVFLFDDFEKEGRRSLAFSMIFQSMECTLVDADVERDMIVIQEALVSLGAEIR